MWAFQARNFPSPASLPFSFPHMQESPLERLVVLLDASGSMRDVACAARRGLHEFVLAQKELNAGLWLDLHSFAEKTACLHSGPVGSLSDDDLGSLVLSISFGGSTRLYDFVLERATALLSAEGEGGRAGFCVMTDGADTGSKATAADSRQALAALEDRGIVVHWVLIGDEAASLRNEPDLALTRQRTTDVPARADGVLRAFTVLSRVSTRCPTEGAGGAGDETDDEMRNEAWDAICGEEDAPPLVLAPLKRCLTSGSQSAAEPPTPCPSQRAQRVARW